MCHVIQDEKFWICGKGRNYLPFFTEKEIKMLIRYWIVVKKDRSMISQKEKEIKFASKVNPLEL